MKDNLGRDIHYLRISVTDRCNLRCQYCMPDEGVPPLAHGDILRFEEFERLVRIMAPLGVNRLRLTGGEPLVRRGIVDFAKNLKAIDGIETLALTTNGVLLEQMAGPLLAAGVEALNISLDTTDPARFCEIARRDEYAAARRGLEAALALPFKAVKVNCVLSPDSDEADWMGVIELARENPLDVRLIEWMPISQQEADGLVAGDEAIARIEAAYGPLQPLGRQAGAGPARYYKPAGFAGRVGIINAMSGCFCEECNRVRLTATGDLKLCLFYDIGLALRPMLRGGAGDEEIRAAILSAVRNKPRQHAGHRLEVEQGNPQPQIQRAAGMSKIGG